MGDCMEARKRIEEMEKIFNMHLEMIKSLLIVLPSSIRHNQVIYGYYIIIKARPIWKLLIYPIRVILMVFLAVY